MTLYNPQLLTVNETSRLTGFGGPMVRQLAHNGKLKIVRVGGRILVERNSLLLYLEANYPYILGKILYGEGKVKQA